MIKIVIDEDSVKERLHPIIQSLIIMITDDELGQFLDKQNMEDSAIDQIIQVLKTELKVVERKRKDYEAGQE